MPRLARLTAVQLTNLRAVAAYEERYSKPLWPGRDGTEQKVLDALVKRGLLLRRMDEHHTRFFYGLSESGRQQLEVADARA